MNYIERTLENNPVRVITIPGNEMWSGVVVYIVCCLDAVVKALEEFKNTDYEWKKCHIHDARQKILEIGIKRIEKLIDEFKNETNLDCTI